ncbi:unnamed protein product [Schistosoma turkestanicum]|nr:unnamed protein product [Schistosoma turkestanicum]
MESIQNANLSNVRICFRLNTGQRIEWNGNPNVSVWSVLEDLALNNPGIADLLSIEHDSSSDENCLAVVFFQTKIVGETSLRNTTLSDLGISHNSSALLQLTNLPRSSMTNPIQRRCDYPKSSALSKSRTNKGQEIATHQIDDVNPQQPIHSLKNIGDVGQQQAPSISHYHPPDHHYPSSSSSSSVRETTLTDDGTFSGFVSPFSVFSDRPTTSAFDNVGQITPKHPPIGQSRQPKTLGEILGINLDLSSSSSSLSPFHRNQAQSSSTVPFNEFKFPADTEGQDLNSALLNSEYSESPNEMVDREFIVFRRQSNIISNEKSSIGDDDDLPEEFFQHTEQDLRNLIRSYRNEWSDNQPLQTSSMRREAHRQRYAKYNRAIIQFQWIDNLIIQACFHPNEKVSALYEFISDLHNSTCNFQLYTSPPKVFLSDRNKTLIEANLVPLSKVFYHPSDIPAENILKSDILNQIHEENIIKAQSIVSYWMNNLPFDNAQQSSSSQRNNNNDLQKNLRRTNQIDPDMSSSVPKWLKLKK